MQKNSSRTSTLDVGVCACCGRSLDGKRRDALYCESGCRSNASKMRRARGLESTRRSSEWSAGPDSLTSEEEAHQALLYATRRVAARYELTRPGRRPDVFAADWLRHEARIDAAILAGDTVEALIAIGRWERFAFAQMPLEGADVDQ